MAGERRRQHLGKYASAALPTLWKILARKGWSHAAFARELAAWLKRPVTNALAAKLLYGDFRAGRQIASYCETLGVRVVLWDKPCPDSWKPHQYPDVRKRARDEATTSSTGTDG